MGDQNIRGDAANDPRGTPCETCGVETTAVDELGRAECSSCAARYLAYVTAISDVTTAIAAALERGRELGLDAERMKRAFDDAMATVAATEA
jgi:hypothetical protein